jgi:hypothetical protein
MMQIWCNASGTHASSVHHFVNHFRQFSKSLNESTPGPDFETSANEKATPQEVIECHA